MVIVGAILVVLAVLLVVLSAIGNEVVQREAVVAGDEIDAVVGGPPILAVEIGRTGQSPADVGERLQVDGRERGSCLIVNNTATLRGGAIAATMEANVADTNYRTALSLGVIQS